MSEFPEEFLSDQLETISVTATASGVQIGSPIESGKVRKITRIHVRGVIDESTQIGLYQGDETDPFETLVDSFLVLEGNPDFIDQTDDLRAPLIVIRPDGTRVDALPEDEINNIVSVRRDEEEDSVITLTFYDEKA